MRIVDIKIRQNYLFFIKLNIYKMCMFLFVHFCVCVCLNKLLIIIIMYCICWSGKIVYSILFHWIL